MGKRATSVGSTRFQMLPEHAFEEGIARALRVAERHSDRPGHPRVDHPAVLKILVCYAAVVEDLQKARDEELAEREARR